jgi:hypothetical protein
MKKRLLFVLVLGFIAYGSTLAQTKTVTNADLEKYRQKRLQSEREYRENYEKLGFPSPEALDRERRQKQAENEETIMRRQQERLENETDFSARAYALRSEIASVEAQISYLNSLLPANQSPTGYFTGGVAPFGYARRGQSNSIWRGDATGRVFLGRNYNRYGRRGFGNVTAIPQLGNPYGYNNGGINLNVGIGFGRVRPRANLNHNAYPYARGRNQIYGYAPLVVEKYDYPQDDISAQLTALEQQRAGLYAEWQLLRENAKRAGVKID